MTAANWDSENDEIALDDNLPEVNANRVRQVMHMIDSTKAVQLLEGWWDEDHADRGKGGRPRKVEFRATLVLLVLLTTEHAPMLAERMRRMVVEQMTDEAFGLLGLVDDSASAEDWYFRLWRSIRRITELLDPIPSPGTHRKRLTRELLDQILSGRDQALESVRLVRVHELCNALIFGSYLAIPRRLRERWDGNTCIDATHVEQFGHGSSDRTDTVAMEWEAAWWLRGNDHRDDGSRVNGKHAWAYDLHLAVMTHNDNRSGEFPLCVTGMSFEKPGFNPGENARNIYTSMHLLDYPKGRIAADRAYFAGSAPEVLHHPLIQMGYNFVTDYKSTQLGSTDSHAGAIQVEGSWYCPSMPRNLINATKDFRDHKIREEIWQARLIERETYRAKRKSLPDKDGFTRFSHPVDKHGRKICDPKRKDAPLFCTQSTITIPPSKGVKLGQEIPFGTPNWKRAYSPARNTIESFNAHLKDESRGALAQPGRRRMRGYATQALFCAMGVIGSNMRKINRFIEKERAAAQALIRTGPATRARRRTESRPIVTNISTVGPEPSRDPPRHE